MFGAALFRLREADFKEIRLAGGISPAWPLSYADFAPYYTRAERLPLGGIALATGFAGEFVILAGLTR